MLYLWFVFITDVLLNALDISDNTAHYHNNESDRNRARSASSSPRTSPVPQRASESNIKPTCLYVSNWTDDEKYRLSKNQMRFNETQLAERLIYKKINVLSFT